MNKRFRIKVRYDTIAAVDNIFVLKRANVTRKEFSMIEQEFTNRIDGLINDYEGGESTSKELRDGILDTLIELVSKVSPFEARVKPKIAEELKSLINKWNSEEDKIDEQIKFLREHKFELEQISTYHKRNEMTSRRLELEQIIDSNFSV